MLNNLTFSVTNKCNSRCEMCNIWKNQNVLDEMSKEQIAVLFEEKVFENVDTISITGGEPFLRNDLNDIIDIICDKLPKLNRIFLNTNGSFVDKTIETSKKCSQKVQNVILSISLEGRQETNKKIRGIDNYDNIIKIIKGLKEDCPQICISLSMTISKINGNFEDLKHVYDISKEYDCDFSFRFADISKEYYKNENADIKILDEQKKVVSVFIEKYMNNNEFLKVLKKFIDTGKVDIFYDKNGKNICIAGKDFAFIKPNGDITPCLYSSVVLGGLNKKIDLTTYSTKLEKKCPCCTDCTVWPMIDYLKQDVK